MQKLPKSILTNPKFVDLMHLQPSLEEHAEDPMPVALIGTGVFGMHVVYQLEEMTGLTPVVLADLEASKAEKTYRRAGVDSDAIVKTDDSDEVAAAIEAGERVVTTDGVVAAEAPVEVVVEVTGVPGPAARHAWAAIAAGNDVVNVSIEADVTVGPLLAQFASEQGVTYSMAYGDEPASTVSLVDWARSAGLEVVVAGQGTELTFKPHATPEDALERYGLPESFIEDNDPDPRMYNTFQDGTKIAVELCAAANAIGFAPDNGSPHIPKTDREGVLKTLRPKEDGGVLEEKGVIDAVTPTDDFRNPSGFVITEAKNEEMQRYFKQRFNIHTENDGKYQFFDRPYHLPPETTVSVASVALNDAPTGTVRTQSSEVVGKAKRDLKPGEVIEGPGAEIYGALESAEKAAADEAIPLELLAGAEVTRPISTDERITEEDVKVDTDSFLYHLRQVQNEVV